MQSKGHEPAATAPEHPSAGKPHRRPGPRGHLRPLRHTPRWGPGSRPRRTARPPGRRPRPMVPAGLPPGRTPINPRLSRGGGSGGGGYQSNARSLPQMFVHLFDLSSVKSPVEHDRSSLAHTLCEHCVCIDLSAPWLRLAYAGRLEIVRMIEIGRAGATEASPEHGSEGR